jgi:hypothetical protein
MGFSSLLVVSFQSWGRLETYWAYGAWVCATAARHQSARLCTASCPYACEDPANLGMHRTRGMIWNYSDNARLSFFRVNDHQAQVVHHRSFTRVRFGARGERQKFKLGRPPFGFSIIRRRMLPLCRSKSLSTLIHSVERARVELPMETSVPSQNVSKGLARQLTRRCHNTMRARTTLTTTSRNRQAKELLSLIPSILVGNLHKNNLSLLLV